MARPTPAPFTEALYGDLPELYRDADAVDGGWPLLRYLSLLGDLGGDVDALAGRVAAGELTDPAAADAEWLPWLAQLVGVKLRRGSTDEARRAAIAEGSNGWQSGTRQSIAAAARAALTGSRFCEVHPNAGGDPWALLIVVRADEAADLAAVAAAVVDAGAKPAGYRLVVSTARPPWDAIDGAYPTWDAIDGQGSWAVIDSTGIA